MTPAERSLRRSNRRRVLAAFVAPAVAIALATGPVAAEPSNPDPSEPPPSTPLDPAVRAACPRGVELPAPAPSGGLRTFSADEFQRLVDLTGTARVIAGSPPPILGDEVADRRIRAIAEARGYRPRTDVGAGDLTWSAGLPLDRETARAWRSLVASARADGVTLTLYSGYRSVARQRSIFSIKLFSSGHGRASVREGRADAAIDRILQRVSIPGFSRHHTGTTIDVLSPGFGTASFGRSAAFAWLSADNYRNAKRHGFVPSYPPGAGAQGPEPEPWEYVFVGVDALTAVGDLPVVDRFERTPDRVRFDGRPRAMDDEYLLHVDDRLVAVARPVCDAAGGPGRVALEAEAPSSGDVCVVQRSTVGDRLVGCRSAPT